MTQKTMTAIRIGSYSSGVQNILIRVLMPVSNRRFAMLGFPCLALLLTMTATSFPVWGQAANFTNSKLSCASDEYAARTPSEHPAAEKKNDSATLEVVPGNKRFNTTNALVMGRPVKVCVMGLHEWSSANAKKNNPISLRLSIGGHILSMPPSAVGPPNEEYLIFILQLDAANSADWKAWAEIVDAARQSEESYNLPISVALSSTSETFESSAFVKVDPYPRLWYLFLILFVVLLISLSYLSSTTDLLRYTPGIAPLLPSRSPYSLGLAQMAFWFCLVLAAYIYICATTRQVHIPMGSVLGLLGISSTTGLAAIFVDRQKNDSLQEHRNTLLAEQTALNTRVADLMSRAVTPGSDIEKTLLDNKSRLAQLDALVGQLPSPPPPPTSKGFVVDLLNDGDGTSFHRFQIAVWTIVLGIVFIWSVYRTISMPEFDASLLTLMGISSGTYVGFKFPEKLKT